MMTEITISLYDILNKQEGREMLSGRDEPEKVREQIRAAFAKASIVKIDLGKLRSLSPSFAYEAFGKLVDEYGENLLQKLQFTNDQLDLKSRIVDALQRRRRVLGSQTS